MPKRRRKLFLSFSGLLQAIYDDKITREDLGQGLFFFFCSPKHVFDTGNGGEGNEAEIIFKNCPQEGKKALDRIRAAVGKAMEENRARWLINDLRKIAIAIKTERLAKYAYFLLNELLAANDYPRLPINTLDAGKYDRKEIARAIKKAGIKLDVIGAIKIP